MLEDRFQEDGMNRLGESIRLEIAALKKSSEIGSLNARGKEMAKVYEAISKSIRTDNYVSPSQWELIRYAVSESVSKSGKCSYIDAMVIAVYINSCSVDIA